MTTLRALPRFSAALLAAALGPALPAWAEVPATPPPGLQLHAEEASFTGSLSSRGKVARASSLMSSAAQGSTWVLRELAQLPTGDTMEATTLDRATSAVLHRDAHQGTTSFSLTYGQNRAVGRFTAEGKEEPVAVDLGGDAFGDGACSAMVLAALPLAEGYQASYRSLNLRSRKLALKLIQVLAQETVTVPAGTFKAWKAVVTNLNGDPGGMTLWSEVGTRRLLRYEARIPVGGAEVVILQEREAAGKN